MKPPLPPLGAEASSVPPTFTVPLVMPPISMMLPLSPVTRVCAWIMPVLLTAFCNRLPAAWVVSSTWPPSARIRPPFCTSALTAPSLTAMLSKPSPATSMVMMLPAASTTLPSWAEMVPWLLTLAPSSAT